MLQQAKAQAKSAGPKPPSASQQPQVVIVQPLGGPRRHLDRVGVGGNYMSQVTGYTSQVTRNKSQVTCSV